MSLDSLIALARIAGQTRTGRWRVTLGGDGLFSLVLPHRVYLYRAPPEKDPLTPAFAGIPGDASLLPVQLESVERSGQGATVWIEPVPETDPTGQWLCAPAEDLKNENDVYVFELIGLPVRAEASGPDLAVVTQFRDTAAHGILVTRVLEDGAEVLLPFVDAIVEIPPDRTFLLVKAFQDFRV